MFSNKTTINMNNGSMSKILLDEVYEMGNFYAVLHKTFDYLILDKSDSLIPYMDNFQNSVQMSSD
jgi:hypothetical protein